jgi:hypothetical protein
VVGEFVGLQFLLECAGVEEAVWFIVAMEKKDGASLLKDLTCYDRRALRYVG